MISAEIRKQLGEMYLINAFAGNRFCKYLSRSKLDIDQSEPVIVIIAVVIKGIGPDIHLVIRAANTIYIYILIDIPFIQRLIHPLRREFPRSILRNSCFVILRVLWVLVLYGFCAG